MNDIIHNDTTSASDYGYSEDQLAERPLLISYWHALLRHRILIAGIMLACLGVGVVATLLATPYYTAASRIEISRNQENVTDVESVSQIDATQDIEFYQTQYALLQARSLGERVARSLNLANDEAFLSSFGIAPEGSTLSAQERSDRMDQATGILLRNINIAPIRGSRLVDVEFRSPSPGLSAKISNEWVAQFVSSTLDRRFGSTQEARDYLAEQLAELRQRLENSERNLVGYAAQKGIVSLNTTTDPATGRTQSSRTLTAADLEALNQELAVATSARIAAGSATAGGNTTKASISSPSLNALRVQRAEISSQLAQLSSRFEPGYPEVVALQSKLDNLQRSIATEEGRIVDGNRSAYAEAVARENGLLRQVSDLKGKLMSEQKSSIQYNIYQREVDTNRELYDGLLQRYKEIGVAGVGSNNIAVVDRAKPPSKPSSPNLPLNIVLALLGGMVLSGAAVLGLEQIDQSLKEPGDITHNLGLTVLGIVPDVGDDMVLTDIEDPKSDASEAYLSIQTNLSFVTSHGVPRSIMFTSTQPNEGKSSSVFALARMLSRTGRRVVVVDADMRNPSLHAMAGVDNGIGLSNYLAGEDDLSAILKSGKWERLTVVTGGTVPPNPGELLTSDRMSELIQKLVEKFEVVLVDAPPVLAIADVPLLATTVEGVVYTIMAEGPKLRPIQASLQRLRSSRANIFGAILTRVDLQDSAYGYGYGYGYGDGFRYGSDDKAAGS